MYLGVSCFLQVNGDIPPQTKKDAHSVILEFIRSRPPLHPVRHSLQFNTLHPAWPQAFHLATSSSGIYKIVYIYSY